MSEMHTRADRAGSVAELRQHDPLDRLTILRSHNGVLAKRVHRDPTGAPVVAGFTGGKWFSVAERPVSSIWCIEEALAELASAHRACVIRGAPLPDTDMARCRRLLHGDPETADPATFYEVSRHWLAVDIDDLPAPLGFDFRREPPACAEFARLQLPGEFHDAPSVWQATGSAGFKTGLRLRLWFWLERPITAREAKLWFGGFPVDFANFEVVTPIYTAGPIFDGVPDPMVRRMGYLDGADLAVPVPDLAEPDPPPRKPLPPAIRTDATAYAAAALRYEAATVATAPAGTNAGRHFHAVREWLDGLAWDGTPRLDRFAPDYLAATADDAGTADYQRAAGRAWLVSAVARVYQPGCKADHCLVLEGAQGIFKSTALRSLAGAGWFADEIADLGSKDAAQDLRGKWLIELAELSALRRGDIERVKAFISRSVDHYRPSYGRRSLDFPRQCVFAGTTNAKTYLPDHTGNRRFWPIPTTGPRLELIQRDRDQLWGEAVAAYRAGERWWLSAATEAHAADEQDARALADPWFGVIAGWLDRQTAQRHTVADILIGALGVEAAHQDRRAEMRVAEALQTLGWTKKRRRPARGYAYEPGP